MTSDETAKEISGRIQQIFAEGDLTALRGLYRPDAVIWTPRSRSMSR